MLAETSNQCSKFTEQITFNTMDVSVKLCISVLCLLSVARLTTARCEERCSILCSTSSQPARPRFRRPQFNRNGAPPCRRECVYVCNGEILQIPDYVQQWRDVQDNTKIKLPFPFAVEFYDEDNDDQISFSEFASTVKCNESDPTTSQAFEMADADGDNYISREELGESPFIMCSRGQQGWRRRQSRRGHPRHRFWEN